MRECEFNLGSLTIRAKRWGTKGALPVIALHGWLDNCASFDFLAPQLKDVDFLALDLAGQGKSDERPGIGAYNIWTDIAEVIAVADQLAWPQFALVGHSRGGMIATLTAGTFPERVSHLALIEGFVPHMLNASQAPMQLASALSAMMKKDMKERTAFPSFDKAVKARERGFVPLVHEDALVLAKRGVQENDGCYRWSNDIRLNYPSEVKFTREQARAFVDRIEPTIHLILGELGVLYDFDHMQTFVEDTANLQLHKLAGDHHLHMSQQATEVAKIINDYFSA